MRKSFSNKILSCIFLFYSFAIFSPAYAQKVFFEQLTTAEGLPSDYVNVLFEDSKGNLWIGTDKGVCRYNGKEFSYFNKDNGLTSNFVFCITEDMKGNIWFGTFEGGLCKYDGTKITPYLLADKQEFKNIFQVFFNHDGSFFLLSGLFHLFFLKDEKSLPEKIPGKDVISVSRAGEDRFLVSGANRICLLEEKKYQLYSTEIWHSANSHTTLLSRTNENRFIIQENNKLLLYETREKSPILIKENVLQNSQPGGYEKTFYSNGREIWMGSYNGLLYINESNVQRFFSFENGLGGKYVNCIYADSKKNIYICTFGGGIRIWPDLYLKEFTVEGKVNFIFPDHKSVYVSSTKGLYILSPSETFNQLKNLRSYNFISIYKSRKDFFYLGTYNSFLKLPDPQLVNYLDIGVKRKYEVLTMVGVSGFQEQNNNRLFVSMYGEGVYVYNDKNIIIDSFTTKNRRIGSNLVEFLKPLKNSLAVLTYNAGLTIIDSNNSSEIISKKDGLLSNSVYSVFQEKENEIWIGTLNGLNLYKAKKIVKTFSYKDGFIGSKVLCIFKDRQMRLWVLSDKWLQIVEGNTLRAIRSHPILLDLKNSINRAEYDTATGNLYLGLTNAFIVIDINRIIVDTLVQLPSLSKVMLNDSIVSRVSTRFSIPPDINNINFTLTNPSNSITKKSDLWYKLIGYNEEWKLLENATELSYQKLPQGKYELMAKTINPDGYVSQEISLIRFTVLPPFWKKAWFLLLASSALLSFFFYAGKKYSRTKYEKKIKQMEGQHRLQLERERIARELHDNVGSQLTYLINKIEDDYTLLSDKSEADKLSNFARRTMRGLRETIWALDKQEVLPEELENKLYQLLRLYTNSQQQIYLNWQYDKDGKKPMKSSEALNIYRIVQEAMNNAAKYSQATLIEVQVLGTQKDLNILIADNGRGCDIQKTEKGYGLQNMQKRAEEMNAMLWIESNQNEGTRVKLHISVEKNTS